MTNLCLCSSTDWRSAAACREEDPELFFPTGSDGPALTQVEQAKAVCRRCPVVNACLQFALDEGITAGVFGGLTEHERVSLRRSVKRGHTAADAVGTKADAAREPRRERTFKTLFEDNTTRLYDGHLAWTASDQVYLGSRKYTPRQIAFIVDRGRNPEGRVLSDCGNSECVLPAHLTDQPERGYCGTRNGYLRHRRAGEEPCGPCRKANTDADNRLRRTGTTKQLAA
jgi:hypothetical protein